MPRPSKLSTLPPSHEASASTACSAAAVRGIIKATRENRRWIKKLRKLGMADDQIARAIEIPADSLLFEESR